MATDNGALATSDVKKSDLIGNAEAGLSLRHKGARLSVSGDMRLNFVGYANHTQPDRLVPAGQIDLAAALVERVLFLEGAVEASRTRADVFAPQGAGPSTANTISTVSYRLSPYFARELTPEIVAIARSDSVFVRNSGDNPALANTQQDARLQRFIARVERRPLPLGIAFEASREDTRYSDAADTALTSESARAIASVALKDEIVLGVIGGREHNVFAGNDTSDFRYGVMGQWRPSSRTLLDAEVEHRFFGTGWFVHLRHRSPLSLVELTSRRAPSSSPIVLSIGEARPDIGSMLDALLKSRIPNESERAQTVHDFLLRQDSSELAGPIGISSGTAQLVQRTELHAVLNGIRTTVTGSLFYVRAEALKGDGAAPPAPGLDTRQWGGSVAVGRRLARVVDGHAELAWSTVEGLGVRSGDYGKQITGSVGIRQALGPRTSFMVGVRRLWSRSFTAAALQPVQIHEAQAFAGIRFGY